MSYRCILQRTNHNMASADPTIMTVTCKMIEAFYTYSASIPSNYSFTAKIVCNFMGIDVIIAIVQTEVLKTA